MSIHECQDLDQYLGRYSTELGLQAQRTLAPLHCPGRDPPLDFGHLLRQPFDAQAHCITAGVKALDHQDALLFPAQVGSGKTLLATITAHEHARRHGRIYRALTFCPPQLCGKWEREILKTLPGVDVHQLHGYRDVMALWRNRHQRPSRPVWWIVSRERAKMGARWTAAFRLGVRGEIPQCPECAEDVLDKNDVPISPERLSSKRLFCQHCGSALWTYCRDAGRLDHYELAKVVHKKLPGYFDYLVIDELHQTKGGANVQQANAVGSLAAACRKIIGLTGTLIGGLAEHLRPLLFRLAPTSLVQEGFGWSDQMRFNEVYGRIETRVTETTDADHSATGRGRRTQTQKTVKPGIMPSLYGRHLIEKTVFLSLDEIASNLPPLSEEAIGVEMDAPLASAYELLESTLRSTVAEMLARGDQRLLGAMLETLLYWPDHPYGWQDVGFWTGAGGDRFFTPVVSPPDLGRSVRPKEKLLLDTIRHEAAAGRQCWVYVQRVGEHDEAARIESLVRPLGLRTKILRSGEVSTAKREEWIARYGPETDVMISHSQPVETGLDFFSGDGAHNFATLIFMQTGYNSLQTRQAAGRAFRIGQTLPCRVLYLYYRGTMQDRALSLMGKKLAASLAIEGKFSSEGLAAMAGQDDEGMRMELARSLVHNFRADVGADRAWRKVTRTCGGLAVPSVALPSRFLLAAGVATGDANVAADQIPVATRRPVAHRSIPLF